MTCQSVQLQWSHSLISQSLWESLLDARIRFQKALTASNLLPSHTEFGSLVEQSSTRDAIHALLEEALLLSEDLFQLQEVRSSASAPVLRPLRLFIVPT
jgi:protein AATF/BFR2